jgi:hypothetical protein
MLVTPRAGVSLDNLTNNLKSLRDEAFNLRGRGSAPTAQVYCLTTSTGPTEQRGRWATRSETAILRRSS